MPIPQSLLLNHIPVLYVGLVVRTNRDFLRPEVFIGPFPHDVPILRDIHLRVRVGFQLKWLSSRGRDIHSIRDAGQYPIICRIRLTQR
jgi:hypothetical protein